MTQLEGTTGGRPPEREALSGHPGLWCSGLDERLAELLIARTLDPRDIRLREMTRDLSRFSSGGQLSQWRPGRDLVCLQDNAGSLLGVIWVAPKEMPERSDYFDPELIRRRGPRLTWAIRTYGEARGHGLAKAFSEHALGRLLRDRPEGQSLWYQTKAANAAARRLGRSLGFFEASGEEGATVVGIRFTAPPPGFLVANTGGDAPTSLRKLGRRLLDRPSIVYRGDRRRGEVALTFDDGPSRWTPEVARVFEEHGCQATFFLRGAAVAEHAQTVAALAAAGQELGNHLWSHSDALTQGQDEIRAEIVRTADAIEAAGGPRPLLVRPPFAKAGQKVARAARRLGVRMIVLRSIGSSDWAAKSAEEVHDPVLATAEPGDIVCLHDGVSPGDNDGGTCEPTVAAVRQLVPALLERGLRPVSVSQLLR